MEYRNAIQFTIVMIAALAVFGCAEEKITVTDFESCVQAGGPIMESYPRQCLAGDIVFVEEITTAPDEQEGCESAGGIWIASAQECEGISETACISLGGMFDPCASACRNDPEAMICTYQCVHVCSFQMVGGDRDEHGCIASAGYTWCEEKQKCLRIWEEDCPSLSLATACEDAGGNWNECSSRCMIDNQGKDDVACPAMCEALCECGGIAGFTCPEGYRCVSPDGIPDALGYCEQD